MSSAASRLSMASTPSIVETHGLKFLITDSPKDANLHTYLKLFKKYSVAHIVRISEPKSYNSDDVERAGIQLHEMHFPDGESPPDEIISKFLELVDSTFPVAGTESNHNQDACIVVHCVAGLGRAPVMVAIALIERGLDAITAVQFIRERRRGAINTVQLSYLESYLPRSGKGTKCVIM
jgi:protein tyrosine phosphatase type IVA